MAETKIFISVLLVLREHFECKQGYNSNPLFLDNNKADQREAYCLGLITNSKQCLHKKLTNTKLRLKKEYPHDDQFIDGAINEYYRFLVLHLIFPNEKIIAGLIVDKVWHDHILHTKEYTEFCTEIFGYYLHHTPIDLSNKGIEHIQSKHLELTQQRYKTLFGHNPPSKYWFGNSDVNNDLFDGCG